jgi:hypothetical protein
MLPNDVTRTAIVQPVQAPQTPPTVGSPKPTAGTAAPQPAQAATPPAAYVGKTPQSSPGAVHIELGASDAATVKNRDFLKVLADAGWSGDDVARDAARLIDNPDSRTLPDALAKAGISKSDLVNLQPDAHAALLENLWTGCVTDGESRAGVIFLKTLARQGKLGALIDELMTDPAKFQTMLKDMDAKHFGVAEVHDLLTTCSPPPKSLAGALNVIHKAQVK